MGEKQTFVYNAPFNKRHQRRLRDAHERRAVLHRDHAHASRRVVEHVDVAHGLALAEDVREERRAHGRAVAVRESPDLAGGVGAAAAAAALPGAHRVFRRPLLQVHPEGALHDDVDAAAAVVVLAEDDSVRRHGELLRGVEQLARFLELSG